MKTSDFRKRALRTINTLVLVAIGLMIAFLIFHEEKRTKENICTLHLEKVAVQKAVWSITTHAHIDDEPSTEELFPPEDEPHCPSYGLYFAGAITNNPSCTVHGILQRKTSETAKK